MYYLIWKKDVQPHVLRLLGKNELLYCGGSPFEAIEVASKNEGAVTSIFFTEIEVEDFCEINKIVLPEPVPEPEFQTHSVKEQNEFFAELEELKAAGLETVTQITESVLDGLDSIGIKEPATNFFKNIQTGGEDAVAKARLLGIKGASATGSMLCNLGEFLKKLG